MQNCTLFHSLFHDAFKVPFTKVQGACWTFVPTLPIMKKISHLGVNHRVPIDLESTLSLPQTVLSIKAPLPGCARGLRHLRILESRKSP
jgi:hypothetical protein